MVCISSDYYGNCFEFAFEDNALVIAAISTISFVLMLHLLITIFNINIKQ